MKITCFIPSAGEGKEQTIESLRSTGLVAGIYELDTLVSSSAIKEIASKANSEYTLVYTKPTELKLGLFALERMACVMDDSQAGMVYADHYQLREGILSNAPVIDYQFGSLRDDFDFGSVLFFATGALKDAVSRMKQNYLFAGLSDLRLKLSQRY